MERRSHPDSLSEGIITRTGWPSLQKILGNLTNSGNGFFRIKTTEIKGLKRWPSIFGLALAGVLAVEGAVRRLRHGDRVRPWKGLFQAEFERSVEPIAFPIGFIVRAFRTGVARCFIRMIHCHSLPDRRCSILPAADR
jgi:hypothetical protein